MKVKEKLIIICVILGGLMGISCLLCVPLMADLKNTESYIIINNVLYGMASGFFVILIAILHKLIKPITIILLLFGCVLLWGELYFIPLNLSGLIAIIFLILSILHGILSFIFTKKHSLLNALLPICFYVGNVILKIIKLDKLIFFHNNFIDRFMIFGLISSIIVLILYLIFKKNRKEKNYYIYMGITFVVSLVCFTFVPYTSLKYINVSFQADVNEVHEVLIVDKKYESGGTKSYRHYILTVLIDEEEYELRIHPAIYNNYEVNDYIILYEYDGLFNTKYLEYKWEEVYIYNK